MNAIYPMRRREPLRLGTAEMLKAWLAIAARGETAEYWRGEVSIKRSFDGELTGARSLLEGMACNPVLVRLTEEARLQAQLGNVRLFQKRLEDGGISYRAVKSFGAPAARPIAFADIAGAEDAPVLHCSSGRAVRRDRFGLLAPHISIIRRGPGFQNWEWILAP